MKTWTCKVPRCGYSFQYEKVPGGRKIQAHNRMAHGVVPERRGGARGGHARAAETRLQRAVATRPPAKGSRNARPRKARAAAEYCEHCGAALPSADVLRIFRALAQNGVGPPAAMEAAKIAAAAMR